MQIAGNSRCCVRSEIYYTIGASRQVSFLKRWKGEAISSQAPFPRLPRPSAFLSREDDSEPFDSERYRHRRFTVTSRDVNRGSSRLKRIDATLPSRKLTVRERWERFCFRRSSGITRSRDECEMPMEVRRHLFQPYRVEFRPPRVNSHYPRILFERRRLCSRECEFFLLLQNEEEVALYVPIISPVYYKRTVIRHLIGKLNVYYLFNWGKLRNYEFKGSGVFDIRRSSDKKCLREWRFHAWQLRGGFIEHENHRDNMNWVVQMLMVFV